MTTEERNKKNVEKINKSREHAIEKYNKDQVLKLIGYIIVMVLICLVAFGIAAIILFSIWNYFNPTKDYLYFFGGTYLIFGSIINLIILIIAEKKFESYRKRKGSQMKLRWRQINRYYNGLINELNK